MVQVQSTLVISNSLISNNRLSRSENLVPVLTQIYQQATKYCGKEEKLLLRSNFSSFPQYFQYISNLGIKLKIHSVRGGFSIVFLSSANLICRTTDISKCFIESLGFRDNGSRLYTVPTRFLWRLQFFVFCICGFKCGVYHFCSSLLRDCGVSCVPSLLWIDAKSSGKARLGNGSVITWGFWTCSKVCGFRLEMIY